MSSIQRRFGLLLGAALLTMAFAAPSAFAIVDFPHEEEAAKWTAVATHDYNGSIENSKECDGAAGGEADCSFSDTGPCEKVVFGILSSCTASWSGDMGSTGNLTATTTSNLPEAGTYTAVICRHTTTKEYWIRAEGPKGGYAFGYVSADPSGLGGATPPDHPRRVSFGMASGTTKHHGISSPTFYGAAFNSMWSEKELLIGALGSEPCDWPEL